MIEKIVGKRALIISALIITFFGGIVSFGSLSKLEDPEIPVKAAVVITSYPGATAEEVDLEVTQVIEKALQKLQHIDYIESRSIPGMSIVNLHLEGYMTVDQLPQKWDHLRKKIADASSSLPKGAAYPIINDDFGDVYGIFMAVSSDGYSYDELEHYTDYIKTRIQMVEGVKRVELVGRKTESVEIIFSPEKFASLGINPMAIVQLIGDQSSVVDAGTSVYGTERVRVNVGNKFQSLDEIANLSIPAGNGKSFRLADIATIERSYLSPARSGLKYNGAESIGLAVSMTKGDNIIKLGQRIEQALEEIYKELPIGIEVNTIYDQPNSVKDAITDFTWNLIMSVGIVILVVFIAIGLKAGLLISSSLVFTILGTFIVMSMTNMTLDKVSLAAIVIAMGMLVDNAIVIADGILFDIKRGVQKDKALFGAVKQNSIPLIGATLVAILAFMPLAYNTTAAGEFMKPLFFVLFVSLTLSWFYAVVQVPFMAKYIYKSSLKEGDEVKGSKAMYNSPFYRFYRGFISYALLHKKIFTISSVLILILSFFAFPLINKDFFPTQQYDQFMVEYKLPEGSDIDAVSRDLDSLTTELLSWGEIKSITSSIAASPVRYTLSRPMNTYNPSYGELIVDLHSADDMTDIMNRISTEMSPKYPNAQIRCREYSAIGGDYKVQALFSGPNTDTLESLANRALDILKQESEAQFANVDWGNQTKALIPVYSPYKAQRFNLSRASMAQAVAISTDGMIVGIYNQEDRKLPIVLKTDDASFKDSKQLLMIPVWGPQSQNSVPMEQIVDSLRIDGEYYIIKRYNGQRAIKVQAQPIPGVTAEKLFLKVRPQIESIPLPLGYALEWHGEYKDSNTANSALFENLPLAILLMVLILVGLFNNFRIPVIIFLIVPMAFIGIIFGFLVTRMNFGFIAIVGGLGLIGMMIKNAVVLIEQINIDIKSGKLPVIAIIQASVSRVRPVVVASLTTILGMFPLITDDIFKGMAIAIMFGLLIGTVITLIVIPVLYALFYGVDTNKLKYVRDARKGKTLKIKGVVVLVLLFSLFSNSTYAQDTLAISLEQSKREALEYSKIIKESALDSKYAQVAVKAAKSAYYPKVEGSGTFYYLPDFDGISYGGNQLIDVDGLQLYTTQLSVSQAIYAGGQIRNSNKIAQQASLIAQEAVNLTTIEVKHAVEKIFWSLYALQEQKSVIDNYIEALDSMESSLKLHYELGLVPKSDYLKVSVKRNEAVLNRTEINNMIDIASMNLAIITGREIDRPLRAVWRSNLNSVLSFGDISADFSNRGELKILDKQLNIAVLNKRVTQGEYLPQLGFSAGYSYYYSPDIVPGMWSPTIGFALKIPIFNGFQRHHKLNMSKIEISKQQLKIEQKRDEISLEVAKAIRDLNFAKERIDVAQYNVEQANETLSEVSISYQNGINTITDLLNAQADNRQAHVSLLRAQTDLKIAYSFYLKAIGSL